MNKGMTNGFAYSMLVIGLVVVSGFYLLRSRGNSSGSFGENYKKKYKLKKLVK